MDLENQPADKLALVYRKLRGVIDEKEEAHKTEIAALKDKLSLVSAKLLELCNAQNVDSLKTAAGTIMRRPVTRYWTSDWQAMYEFIKTHDAPFLLEQRIHNTHMKQFIEENPEVLPVGLNADTKYVISVRKPTNK